MFLHAIQDHLISEIEKEIYFLNYLRLVGEEWLKYLNNPQGASVEKNDSKIFCTSHASSVLIF
jgi:hypothetical protein